MIGVVIGDWTAIAGVLGVIGALAATAWLNSRAKSGEAWRETSEAFAAELAAQKETNARLVEVDKGRAIELVELRAELDNLRSLGDMADQFARHESNAQSRADRTHDLQEKTVDLQERTLETLERVASAVEQTGGTP